MEKRFDLIMDCEECNEFYVTKDRVLEYANNRLEANPEESRYYRPPLKFDDAVRVIESFNEEVKEVLITKDNIHLYYEFMSGEDISKNSNILLTIINNRISTVLDSLKLIKNDAGNYDQIQLYGHFEGKFQKLDSTYGTIPLKYFTFGVKDTLKPIDEYIEEIENSEEYIKYLKINSFSNEIWELVFKNFSGQNGGLNSFSPNQQKHLRYSFSKEKTIIKDEAKKVTFQYKTKKGMLKYSINKSSEEYKRYLKSKRN